MTPKLKWIGTSSAKLLPTNTTRYATSAFLRAKLGEAFSQRNIAPFHFYREQ